MAREYYENWKKSARGQEQLKKWVYDPDGILTGNGYISGIYEISYYNVKTAEEISAYIGQAGYCDTAPRYVARDIYERVLQHLKRWLGGYFSYWTGLDPEETNWKIKIELLEEENIQSLRLKKETQYIEKKKPFMQDTAEGRFVKYPSKYGYKRNDLALHPWNNQRREAFLFRLDELSSMQNEA